MIESADLSAIIPVGGRHGDLAALFREYRSALAGLGRATEFIFVLDGPHPDPEGPDRGGEMAIHHMLGIGRDQSPVRCTEENPGIATGGGNGEPDGLAAMETDALDAHRLPNRRLLVHGREAREQAGCHFRITEPN